MNLTEIKSLIDAMAASDLSEMALTRDGTTLRLMRQQAASSRVAPAAGTAPSPEPALPASAASRPARRTAGPTAASAPAAGTEIATPLYGVVHWRPSPDAAPFVAPGQAIQAGQVVCVVEAMKVFNEIRAESDATVLALLVDSGAEVEAGQPLLRLG